MNGTGKNQVQLPRARIGGLQKGPVEDLLRRIARDFAQLENENKRLWVALEGLGDGGESGPRPAASEAARATEAGQAALADVPGSIPPGRPEPRVRTYPPSPEWRRESDSLATAMLALAQQAADELRESTRQECELMIKKTRDRADRLQVDLERSREQAAAELAELQALRSELREHMRSSLEALLRTFLAERSGELPALAWRDPVALLGPPEPIAPRKKRKKHKS